MKFFIVGNPENRRVQLFSESLILSGYDKPIVLSYLDILKNNLLEKFDFSNSILRIESPGENFEVRKQLIAKGADFVDTLESSYITKKDALYLKEDIGEIAHTQQWYLGFVAILNKIQQAINKYPTCKIMNATSDIAIMFDKTACQQHLRNHQIPIPDFFTTIKNYHELLALMKAQKLSKVFIKPAHASSASGVIAFRFSGDKQQAITSIEIKKEQDKIKLYNSLKIKTYTNKEDIEIIINKILQEKAIVEEWLNKATLKEYYFDVRIVVIKGKARHLVVRKSKNIITNLHLGNKRGTLEELENTIEKNKIEELKSIAEKTAACFPSTLYCGIDVLITSNKKEIKVLEVNAFGDLLSNIFHDNESCYEAEIKAMMQDIK